MQVLLVNLVHVILAKKEMEFVKLNAIMKQFDCLESNVKKKIKSAVYLTQNKSNYF